MDAFELQLSDQDFEALARLVHRKAGISLHQGKKELVRARLSKRVREGRFSGFGDYYDYVVQDENSDELVALLDSISTNLTYFFREPAHFRFMADTWLPELAAAKKREKRPRLRLWSAGCSTGEEAYSMAMTILKHSSFFSEGDIKILATDLSTEVLAQGPPGGVPGGPGQGRPPGRAAPFLPERPEPGRGLLPGQGGNSEHGGFPPFQPDGRLSVPGTLRPHLLPQRHDLF